jgi:nickel/cobalt transporter (NicO) family protein
VTGPDHVLSLGPMALGSRHSPWRIGVSWGIGHAAGTLLLCLPVMAFAHAVHLPLLASIGDRLAGLALLLTAAWSFHQTRSHAAGATQSALPHDALPVGFVHGLTGAASLMLVVPMLASSSGLTSIAFLLAFAAGSTLGMAGLTALLARFGATLDPRIAHRSRLLLCAASAATGLFWLLTR